MQKQISPFLHLNKMGSSGIELRNVLYNFWHEIKVVIKVVIKFCRHIVLHQANSTLVQVTKKTWDLA
jgi:hypothetical protein